MHITHYHLVTLLWLAAILTLGCDNNSTGPSTGPATKPTTGSIEITVATKSADIDVDPDGYSLHIGGAGSGDELSPGEFRSLFALLRDSESRAVGVNAIVTVAALPTGRHIVQLDGLAANCWVGSANPRWVDVTTDNVTLVSFPVTCTSIVIDDGGWWDW